jgi:hypothetical protein
MLCYDIHKVFYQSTLCCCARMSSLVGKGGSPETKAKRLKGNSTGVRAKATLKKALQDGTLRGLLWRDLSRTEFSDSENDPASQVPIVFDDEDTDEGSEVNPEAEQKSDDSTPTVPNDLTSDCSKLLFRGSAKMPRLSSALGGLPQLHQQRRITHLKPDGDIDHTDESPPAMKAPRLRAFTQIMQKLRLAANEAKLVPTQEAQSSDSEVSEGPEVPGEQEDTIAPVAVSILAVQGCKYFEPVAHHNNCLCSVHHREM